MVFSLGYVCLVRTYVPGSTTFTVSTIFLRGTRNDGLEIVRMVSCSFAVMNSDSKFKEQAFVAIWVESPCIAVHLPVLMLSLLLLRLIIVLGLTVIAQRAIPRRIWALYSTIKLLRPQRSASGLTGNHE
jgi:hypothetical protein